VALLFKFIRYYKNQPKIINSYLYANFYIPGMTNKITKSELAEIKEKNKGSRSYTNGEVTVYWRPHLCIHSANCLIGLPKVFDNSSRPWIKPQEASGKDIMRVVNTCPTRAITYLNTCATAAADKPKPPPDKTAAVRVQIMKNGPALIRGNFFITDGSGNLIESDNEVASICRCGGSKKKPFCDGTHLKIGFTD
jgi:uncharacterized Fe-S cluster protein YjdI